MSLGANNDFLNQAPGKKRRTAQEIEQDNFPEYYALNKNQRNSLDATNYWRVMNGQTEIKVPPSDEQYHKYFDKRCFELAEKYQKCRTFFPLSMVPATPSPAPTTIKKKSKK